MMVDDNKRFNDIFGDDEEDFNSYRESDFQASMANKQTIVEHFEAEDGSAISVERSVETSNEVEMISEQPTAIDGIFYSIDDDGYITANVHDMADDLQIRFIGTSDKRQHAMLLKSDVEAAEKYRTEMEEMFSEDED